MTFWILQQAQIMAPPRINFNPNIRVEVTYSEVSHIQESYGVPE
jgi:hypothetical protein